jgi:hypothetical protein
MEQVVNKLVGGLVGNKWCQHSGLLLAERLQTNPGDGERLERKVSWKREMKSNQQVPT